MVGLVPIAQSLVLVALNLERDGRGRYHVCSFYQISEKKARDRRFKGFLKIPKLG
jgi:hypothetical protein